VPGKPLLLAVPVLSNRRSLSVKPSAIDTVLDAFEWFNAVMGRPDAVITRQDVERRFTADAKMIANGQTKCVGIDGHLKHFQEIQRKLKAFRIRLPLECSITSEHEAAAYYQIDYVPVDGSAGIIHDSAIWRIRDDKIALMVETVAFEGREVVLENHA
jgi:hypothetical protein